MFFAKDINNRKCHIDETASNKKYYCCLCGSEMVIKKGKKKVHHFAHKSNAVCNVDDWDRKNEMSEWHIGWQDKFPMDNREIRLDFGGECHRADIVVGNNVIEFQHSKMPVNEFDRRNRFYNNAGFRVIWMFDLSKLYGSKKISIDRYYEQEIAFKFN